MQQNVNETDLPFASLDHSNIHCQLLTIRAYVCHIKEPRVIVSGVNIEWPLTS